MKKTLKYKLTAILLLAVTALSCTACNSTQKDNYFVFGTAVSVSLSGGGAGKRLKEYDKLFSRLDADFDAEIEGSSLYKINHAAADVNIEISPEAYALIKLAKEVYVETEGVFNIATYPLSELWKFTSTTFDALDTDYAPPSDDDISAALLHCDLNKLILLENNTVKKLDVGLKLGFGAIAKGFAGDKAKEYLSGKETGVLDVGGTIFTVGDKEFKIGISNPRETDAPYFAKIILGGGACICTSGDYHRYYTAADGTRYCHILGKDGRPVSNGLISVTIVSEKGKISGATCDVLSTAVFALGREKGKALLEKYGASAVLIYDNKTFERVGDFNFELTDTSYTENV